jgi:hypothetical protein
MKSAILVVLLALAARPDVAAEALVHDVTA